MDGQHLGIRRGEDAVSFIERNSTVLIGNRAAPIDAEQHTKSQFISTVMHGLTSFDVNHHSVYFKILAAGQQLRGNTLPVFQHPEGLLRLCTALQVRYIQRLVDV